MKKEYLGLEHSEAYRGLDLGHARADNTANENKNVSHNTLNYRDFTMKTDFKSRLPP